MKKLSILIAVCLWLGLGTLPALAADTVGETPASPSADEFLGWLASGAAQAPDGSADAAGGAQRFDALGCTASYNCVHGTIVTCTGTVNTSCSSSGGGCGSVTCDGVTTWCPGSCRTDVHCFSFCSSQGSFDGYCDWAGCCVCL